MESGMSPASSDLPYQPVYSMNHVLSQLCGRWHSRTYPSCIRAMQCVCVCIRAGPYLSISIHNMASLHILMDLFSTESGQENLFFSLRFSTRFKGWLRMSIWFDSTIRVIRKIVCCGCLDRYGLDGFVWWWESGLWTMVYHEQRRWNVYAISV